MCIMIMAVIAGAIGFELKGMIGVHRFRHDTCKIKEQLEKAQLLALIYNTDMRVTLAKDKDTWVLMTHSDELALQHLNKARIKLEGISALSLEGSRGKGSKIVLDILSNGRIEPLAALKMEGKNRVRYLDFQNPIQINFADKHNRPLSLTVPKQPGGHHATI